jgi:hypothetical protein
VRGANRLRYVAATAAALVVAAGCGNGGGDPAKSARTHVRSAHQLAITLHFSDPDGSLMHEMTSGSDPAPRATAEAIEHGTITFEVSSTDGKPVLAHRLARTSLADQVKEFNLDIEVHVRGTTLGALRVVNGVLYGTADLDAIDALAKASGGDDFLAHVPPQLSQLVSDLRHGEWVQLPLASYLDVAQGYLPRQVTPAGISRTYARMVGLVGRDTTVTTTSTSGNDETQRVTLNWRRLLKDEAAALASVLPGGAIPSDANAEIDRTFTARAVQATLKIADGHYQSLTVPMEQFTKLAAKPTGRVPSFGAAAVVVGINDQPTPVVAPTKVSSFRLGQLFGLG